MDTLNVIIETPKGSAEKYTFDKKLGHFKLKKILPSGMMFPYDFGFIPNTKGEDKDPLDALVISEFKSFPGCVMECRLIGAILAEQSDKKGTIRNDRYFFVPVLSKQFKKIKEIRDLPKEEREETEDFFCRYNEEEGKKFRIIDIIDPKKAMKLIEEQNK